MTLEHEVEEALACLGNTAREVAESLKVKSIQGNRHRAYSCPIATYLKGRFPTYKAEVDDANACLFGPSAHIGIKIKPAMRRVCKRV